MSIYNCWNIPILPEIKESCTIARHFLSRFDLDIHHMPSKKIHILDYLGGGNGFNQLKNSFNTLAQQENISDVEITSKIEDEPAATLIFLFLSDPKLSVYLRMKTTV